MKDPKDHATIDGFADLVTLIENNSESSSGVPLSDLKQLIDHLRPKKKAGRKPAGDVALTPAEKQKAYRERKKQSKLEKESRLLDIRLGRPVDSDVIDLNTSFTEALRK